MSLILTPVITVLHYFMHLDLDNDDRVNTFGRKTRRKFFNDSGKKMCLSLTSDKFIGRFDDGSLPELCNANFLRCMIMK